MEKKKKFEVGMIYETRNPRDFLHRYKIVCTKRTAKYTTFDIYKAGEFIKTERRAPHINSSGYESVSLCFGILESNNYFENLQSSSNEFEKMINTLINAEVFEVYGDYNGREGTYYYKVARKFYSKPYWFMSDIKRLEFHTSTDPIEQYEIFNKQFGFDLEITKFEIDNECVEELIKQILKNFTFYKNSIR